MSTYAIGDIQGCLQPLLNLLKKVDFSPSRDSLWLAGDLVNRGPESLETLRYLHALGGSVKAVLGNHDLHLIACHHGHRGFGKKDTFSDILDAPEREELIAWLSAQPLIHRDTALGFIMVHAGIPPIWSFDKALELAGEVETVLREDPDLYLSGMYGNQPERWRDDLEGQDRWRSITNYLTRMRFCRADGTLEFATKSELTSPMAGFLPWFEHPRAEEKEKLLFGHWAALMGDTKKPNIIGLDRGCVWGGELYSICLDTEQSHCEDCGLRPTAI